MMRRPEEDSRLSIYLPIAGLSINVLLIVGIGFAVGYLSGMFGVGGGFLITPLLGVVGIPIDVAVATGANSAVATSAAGALAQWRRGNVDIKMGGLQFGGSVFGSFAGVGFVALLKGTGQIDVVIALLYVVLLGAVGLLMLIEGTIAILRERRGYAASARRRRHTWVHNLPFKTRFAASKLYMSVIPPVALGFLVGLLGGIMGVGGGFFAVPIMVYVLGMPTRVVVGTSLVLVLASSSLTTVLQAWQNHSVDIVLAVVLTAGGVIGAQLGTRASHHFKGEQIRALLGLLVVVVSLRIAFGLIVAPEDVYSISVPRLNL
jgi:uncharacterized membrane protein YfcA